MVGVRMSVGCLLLCGAILLSGCRQTSETISLTASETASARQGRGFGLAGQDVDGEGPTLRVSVGRPVTVNLANAHGQYYADSESHDFAVVLDKDQPRGDWVYLWDSRIESIEPGGSGSVTFTPDTPGTYFYVCTLLGHVRHGMWGEFIVEG